VTEGTREALAGLGWLAYFLVRVLGELKRLGIIAIGIAFVVMGNTPGRIIGVVILAIVLWLPIGQGASLAARLHSRARKRLAHTS
jgi:hypothetical protein